MDFPLVSVIIPNYNHALYLDKRIQSVLNQTYPNFEVIILDDKSLDNSVEVINKYKNNKHIKHIVINEQNSGSTFIQWNRGLELASGELIWIAESDDYCETFFLERCINEYLKRPTASIIYCSSEYVDAYNKDLGTYSDYTGKIFYLKGNEFIKKRMAFGCAIWNASSAIFRKDVALKIDYQYQSFKACGDKLFWIEMAENGDVIHINETMNYFRQHENKVSPKRFRDGTSLVEERKIYKYQCNRGFLFGLKRIYVLQLYKNKIDTGDYDSVDIENSINKLWGFDKPFKKYSIRLISRSYQYFCLYILRRKPI